MSQAAILPRPFDRRPRLPKKKAKHIALNINIDEKKQNMVEEVRNMVSRFIYLYARCLDETLKTDCNPAPLPKRRRSSITTKVLTEKKARKSS